MAQGSGRIRAEKGKGRGMSEVEGVGTQFRQIVLDAMSPGTSKRHPLYLLRLVPTEDLKSLSILISSQGLKEAVFTFPSQASQSSFPRAYSQPVSVGLYAVAGKGKDWTARFIFYIRDILIRLQLQAYLLGNKFYRAQKHSLSSRTT